MLPSILLIVRKWFLVSFWRWVSQIWKNNLWSPNRKILNFVSSEMLVETWLQLQILLLFFISYNQKMFILIFCCRLFPLYHALLHLFWAEVLRETTSLSLKGRGKVCVHPTLRIPHLQDGARYAVVVNTTFLINTQFMSKQLLWISYHFDFAWPI